ncbi:MAG: nucleoside recognition domain-containing protein [Bacillota bacterium]|jgi:sporulation integral membrane protein YlbJ
MSKIKVIIGIFSFVLMLTNPQMVYEAAVFAIETWWNNVIPALLPFFIVSEFLMAVGLMECLAVWLEPVMRPLFRLSGGSALAIVMGFVSGTPTAANITANLYKNRLCSKDEAERLLAFTNNSGPLYILVAVAVGIFQNPAVGIILFLSHYPINFCLGIILRFFAQDKRKRENIFPSVNIISMGFNIIKCCQSPPLGRLLNIVVKKSLMNIGVVGGFMVVFGILTASFDIAGITGLLSALLTPLALLFNIDASCLPAMAAGFWEMTIGIAVLPQSGADMLSMLLASSIILAWNGVSIQSQVAAMVADTDLKLNKYRICRIIHSLTAPLVILFMYKKTAPVFAVCSPDAVNFLSFITPFSLLLLSLIMLALTGLLGIIIFKRKNRNY